MELDKGGILIQVANAKLGKQSAYNFLLDHFWNEVYGFQINVFKMNLKPKTLP